MASGRETILARLLLLAQGVPGINAAVRNAADVPGLVRPAIIIEDGAEALDVSPIDGGVGAAKPRGVRLSQRQRMAMTPDIKILASASAAAVGTLLNQCAERFIAALMQDEELLAAVGIDPASKTGVGEIRYEECLLEPAPATSTERRLTLKLIFVYIYQTAGL